MSKTRSRPRRNSRRWSRGGGCSAAAQFAGRACHLSAGFRDACGIPALLEREDCTLAAWYRSIYAPRTGGAYDSHHRTAGIAGRTRRRGGRVAAYDAGAADGDAGDRISRRPDAAARVEATRLRSGGLHSLIKFEVCGQCQDTASGFVGPVPTYRLDWIVVSYSRVAIALSSTGVDGRHWRPPTPYPC